MPSKMVAGNCNVLKGGMLPREFRSPEISYPSELARPLGWMGSRPGPVLLLIALGLGLASGLLAQSQTSSMGVRVASRWNGPRRELLRVSVPFAKGSCRDLASWSVKGLQTAWTALSYWPDGSIQWGQAQFVAELKALEKKRFAIEHVARPVLDHIDRGRPIGRSHLPVPCHRWLARVGVSGAAVEKCLQRAERDDSHQIILP